MAPAIPRTKDARIILHVPRSNKLAQISCLASARSRSKLRMLPTLYDAPTIFPASGAGNNVETCSSARIE